VNPAEEVLQAMSWAKSSAKGSRSRQGGEHEQLVGKTTLDQGLRFNASEVICNARRGRHCHGFSLHYKV